MFNYTNNSVTSGIDDLSNSINDMEYMIGNLTQMFYNISDYVSEIDITDIKINYGIIMIALLIFILMLI